ncbi:DUF1648 domain-containing protein [Haliscomenobacter sp.]|uniref:DUF1648 domain-containing protein n=1 Tax=Haliscomenobacter sp. TaxID=2717303 RepID=UPI0035940E5D
MFGQKTAFDYTIGIMALLLMCLQVYLVVQYWPDLPERLPTHYNFQGKPDAYGAKSSILFLPLLGVGIFVMTTVVAMYPQSMNLPVKVTDENREQLYAKGTRFVHILRFLISVLFAYILWGTIGVGLGWQNQLDNRILIGFLGLMALTMLWFFVGKAKK